MESAPQTREPDRTTAEQVWPVGEVAVLLGVPAVTIRSWEVRYGVGPARRTPGRHRRYSSSDVERLRRMCGLIAAGTPAREAALLSRPELPQRRPAPSADLVVDEASLLVADAEAYRPRLLAARLDECFQELGLRDSWVRVVTPALRLLEARYHRSGDCTDVELLLVQGATEAVDRYVDRRRLGHDEGRPVLLVCCPEERHVLPLKFLQATLLERGRPTVLLGSDAPAEAVLQAVDHARPRVVVLWSIQRRPGQAALRRSITSAGTPVALAGSGWPRDARALTSLDAAIADLAAR